MINSIRARLYDEEGQGLVEYTLIVSLIALVSIFALTQTGLSLAGIISSIAGKV